MAPRWYFRDVTSFPQVPQNHFYCMYLLMQVLEHMVLLPIFATTTTHL